MPHPHLIAFLLLTLALFKGAQATSPTLLIPGMDQDLDARESATSGRTPTWSSTIAFLEHQGMHFGGSFLVSGNGGQPGSVYDPKANLFELRFSAGAAVDGIGLKALEVARAVQRLRTHTKAAKVNLIAYSAGGLAARLYLQNALAGVPYRGDVERLITIATPHLGAAFATRLGDWLGTRATSLKPDADTIVSLNRDLPLPADTLFAAIVVRGLGADVRGKGRSYVALADPARIDDLPWDLSTGGDQVVHVRSQNLALAPQAKKYEQYSGRPILYLLARVPDPSPGDLDWNGRKVHEVALDDPEVQTTLWQLLQDDSAWTDNGPTWQKQQLRLHAYGLAEQALLARKPWARITDGELISYTPIPDRGARFRFIARIETRGYLLRSWKRHWRVAAEAGCELDDFGRVHRCAPTGRVSIHNQ
ncbi:MAG: hypothetical protein KDH88_16305 [Chromatiales bacterium]|nr:hypothetical protein [Chromatiales bacterium]